MGELDFRVRPQAFRSTVSSGCRCMRDADYGNDCRILSCGEGGARLSGPIRMGVEK